MHSTHICRHTNNTMLCRTKSRIYSCSLVNACQTMCKTIFVFQIAIAIARLKYYLLKRLAQQHHKLYNHVLIEYILCAMCVWYSEHFRLDGAAGIPSFICTCFMPFYLNSHSLFSLFSFFFAVQISSTVIDNWINFPKSDFFLLSDSTVWLTIRIRFHCTKHTLNTRKFPHFKFSSLIIPFELRSRIIINRLLITESI